MPIKGIKGGVGTKALGYGLGGVDVESSEPHFNQTVLLLHGDGSEGEGNTSALGNPNYKAFKDNSTSAHAITVEGDAYGNDFSPYYYADGYWSNSFDGTDDVLNIADDASLDFGTGDWTVECRFNQTKALSDYQTLWSKYASNVGYYIFTTSAGKILLGISNVSSTTSTATFSLNTWHHLAVTKYSGVLYVWLDGVQIATLTSASSLDNSTPFLIGNINGFSRFFGGYISNFRIVKGTALYTSGFTPSTSPFTTTSQSATASEVELLTCQSNRFVDNSSEEHSITLTSSPKVSTNTPFTQSKTANVGSGFFDGSGDYLAIGDNSAFAFGTGDFTIEGWIYLTSTGTFRHFYDQRPASTDGDYPTLRLNGSNAIEYVEGGSVRITSSGLSQNTWHHFAITRSGSSTKLFVNGTQDGSTYSDSTNYLCGTGRPFVGGSGYHGSTLGFNGYLSNIRVVNGTAVYTSTFTPPTTTLASTGSETKLLTCQYSGAVRNVGFTDDSKYNHQITRNGDVSLGTFSPFSLEDGYWSNYISPNSGLKFSNSSAFAFGTGAFTIEFWVFGGADNDQDVILEGRSAVGGSFHITYGGYSSTSNSLRYVPGSGSTITTGTDLIADNTWHHCAIERDASNNVTLYIDGVSKGTGTDSTDYSTTTGTWSIGYSFTASSNYSNAYYSNFRIVKGSNVYGGAFTPPTTPLTAVPNTQLLTCQSNKFIDNSSNGLTLTLVGTPKVQPFSPLAPTRSYSKDAVGGSAFFDGSGDDLTIPRSSDFVFGTGQFTIECFVYYTSQTLSSNNAIIGQSGFGSVLQLNSSGYVQYYDQNTSHYPLTGNVAVPLNMWNHIVVQRNSSNNLDLFVNGTRQDTTGNTTSTLGFMANQDLTIHSWDGTATSNQEYISNVRIVKGSAVYTSGSSITVPTAPFTADSNTKLLLNFTNAGIIDHTMKNNLDTEGNTRISTRVKKFSTGSIYFDSNDYMYIPDSPLFLMGDGDFTFECFLYFTSNIGNSSGDYRMLLSDASTNSNYLTIRGHGTETNGVFQYNFSGSSANMSLGNGLTSNSWHHLAFSREGTTLRLYVNGTLTETDTSISNDFNLNSNGGGVYVGAFNGPNHYLNGYMDEARLTKGVARYTGSSLTVPTKTFANK